jgi:hypothetical protein
MPRTATYLFAAMVIASPAHADWLERAWSAEVVKTTGAPAITLAATGILLVLPEAALQEALAAGVSTEEAVRLMVQHYGQHCSAILDLDQPHPRLPVQLILQKPVALEDATERVQETVLDALKSLSTKPLPHVQNLFVSAEEHTDLVIDYVPTRKAHCVQPGAAIS